MGLAFHRVKTSCNLKMLTKWHPAVPGCHFKQRKPPVDWRPKLHIASILYFESFDGLGLQMSHNFLWCCRAKSTDKEDVSFWCTIAAITAHGGSPEPRKYNNQPTWYQLMWRDRAMSTVLSLIGIENCRFVMVQACSCMKNPILVDWLLITQRLKCHHVLHNVMTIIALYCMSHATTRGERRRRLRHGDWWFSLRKFSRGTLVEQAKKDFVHTLYTGWIKFN